MGAVVKFRAQVGGVIGMEYHRGSARKGPDNPVGVSIRRDARHTALAAEIGGGLGGKGRDIKAVGEGEGLQGLGGHAPINVFRGPVAVDGGRRVAPSPDGNHHLGDVVGACVEVAEIRGIHHIKIPRFVRAEHQVGMGRRAPGSGKQALARGTDILVARAEGRLVHGGEIIQHGHGVAGGVQLEETLAVIGHRGRLVEVAVGS